MITITALAQELGATVQDIEALVGQLIGIDGHEAVVAQETPIYNGSGRLIGYEVALTDEAAEVIREHLA